MIYEEPEYNSQELADALVTSVGALLRVPVIRQMMQDVLRTYGLTSQFGELLRTQHEQILALAEATALMYARLIEHDRRAITSFVNTVELMKQVELLVNRQGGPEVITQASAAALALVRDETASQIALIDEEAAVARELFRIAQQKTKELLEVAAAVAEKLAEAKTPLGTEEA